MKAITLVVAITLFSVGAIAQGHGTAPQFWVPNEYTNSGTENTFYVMFYASNLYPWSFSGDIWTGTVTAIHGPKISLAWTNKKGKTESFTGEVVRSYPVPTMDGATRTIAVAPPLQSLVGRKVIVYYITDTGKVEKGGKKVKVNRNYIFRLDPQEGKQ